MLELIKNECNKIENIAITENGAKGLKSSGSALVDINFKVSSLRNSDEKEIENLFEKAFNENSEYALKWLFFARDVREGLGERRLFRICYKKLFELNKILFYKNLNNIVEYGRWDDIVYLIGIDDEIDNHIIEIIRLQLKEDLDNLSKDEGISLLSKWMPSENASSKETKKMARNIIKLLNISPRKYRLMLSKLRSHSNVVETKMCSNKWSEIDYEKVPSLANLKYSNAFMNHDRIRRSEYLELLSKGETKINMKVATPVDIVSKYDSWYVKDLDPTLELAWKNLKKVGIENTLVVADGSGSMTVPVSGRVTALDVANSIAIYTSENNEGIYKNKYITFSNTPKFVEFNEEDTLQEKLSIARKHNEIANTNIERVFDLILYVAIQNNIPNDEMVKNVLIISDMEFDMAQRGWRNDIESLSKTLFDEIKDKYSKAGYTLPKLIFWNVNSRTKTIPLTENELGVALISGFSQNVLKMVMSGHYDPYEILIETITDKRYDRIICK